MTSEQLGSALGYTEARKSIGNLVNRNEYLKSEEFASVINLMTEAGSRETRVFTEDGIYEVTMLAKTARAREFRAKVRKILKELRTGFIQLSPGSQKVRKELTLLNAHLDTLEKIATIQQPTKKAKRKLYSDSLTQFAAATGIDCNLFIEALNQTPERKPRGPYKPREAKSSRITGERVYTARILRGWSQRALAGKLGTSNSIVWLMERDERAVTMQMQSRLLNVLGMTLPELLALPTVLMDGERFAAARTHIARALEELAEALGVSKETLEAIENDTGKISHELQTDFLRYANLTLEELKELPAAPWKLIIRE